MVVKVSFGKWNDEEHLPILVELVSLSPYLFIRKHAWYSNTMLRELRWIEIGKQFDFSGEEIAKKWLVNVAKYRNTLKSVVVTKLKGVNYDGHPGEWFDQIGKLLGLPFEELDRVLDRSASLHDNMLLIVKHNPYYCSS